MRGHGKRNKISRLLYCCEQIWFMLRPLLSSAFEAQQKQGSIFLLLLWGRLAASRLVSIQEIMKSVSSYKPQSPLAVSLSRLAGIHHLSPSYKNSIKCWCFVIFGQPASASNIVQRPTSAVDDRLTLLLGLINTPLPRHFSTTRLLGKNLRLFSPQLFCMFYSIKKTTLKYSIDISIQSCYSVLR